MPLPQELQRAADKALNVVIKHPDHEYGPKHRRRLFQVVRSDPVMIRTWKWLAVISSRRVLPIYEAYIDTLNKNEWYYNFAAPNIHLKAAEDVLQGKLEAKHGYEMANAAYEQSDFDYRLVSKPVPFRIYQAAWSSTIALLEISQMDHDPFATLPNRAYAANGFFYGRGVAEDIRKEFPDGIPGEDFTDALWTESGHSDTAAVASIAWACDESSKISQPQKLLYFWHWWLTDALNEAWDIANKP
jgi:hypothetical protein